MAVPLEVATAPVDAAGDRAASLERRFEAPMLVVTLLMVPLFVLEGAHHGAAGRAVAAALNWLTWSAFLLEAAVMLAVVRPRRVWLRSHPVAVAVVLLTVPLLPASLQTLRVLRLLRLVRLLALWERVKRMFTLEGLRYAALAAAVVLVGGGAAFSAVERKVSTWDGIWWAATTMTTVGYGDLYPHTTAGRVIALVVMVTGIGFGTIAIAGLANVFVSRTLTSEVGRVEELERDVERTEVDLLAELRAVRRRLEELEQAVAHGAGASPSAGAGDSGGARTT